MKSLRVAVIAGLVGISPLRAVYAPIPAQEQGKDLTVSLRAGLSHDSNIFGAATNEVDSFVWEVAPRIAYNASLTAQTFLSAAYGLRLDYFDDRPGDKSLDSHDALLRLAHSFSPSTSLDINDLFTVARNPESLLAGVPLNTDQSYRRNQLDGRWTTGLTAKVGLTVKARSINYHYRNASLGRGLDRTENLYGLSGDFALLPEFKLVGEYRHQDVYYRKLGETKNKNSDFLMGGLDYAIAQKLTLSGRLGAEWRDRAAERDTTAPYVELSGKYDYAPASFFAGGYGYTLDETSDTARFTDAKIHRLFANVQHRVTALITASGSFTYEPSRLLGRRGQVNIDETTTRFGAALSYLPSKNWVIAATYDYDRVSSDDPVRKMRRNRVGVSASYSF
jgi:hypothetical protein